MDPVQDGLWMDGDAATSSAVGPSGTCFYGTVLSCTPWYSERNARRVADSCVLNQKYALETISAQVYWEREELKRVGVRHP